MYISHSSKIPGQPRDELQWEEEEEEDFLRLRTCFEVFQNNFGSWFSDDNKWSSLSKYSCFDFLISLTTLFRVLLYFPQK